MIDTSEYILLGKSYIEPESDIENQFEIERNADKSILHSRSIDIINSIGSTTFKQIYLSLINEIKEYSFEDQVLFMEMILEKINKVYDFEFLEEVDINSWETIHDLYLFLEFLEYDNIDFTTEVWKLLDINPMKVDILRYCYLNKNKIILEIEEQSDILLNGMLLDFIKSYYKIIDWFGVHSDRLKVEIAVNLFTEKE